MAAEASSTDRFRRLLFHSRGKEISSLLAALPADTIEPLPFDPSRLRLEANDVAVILLDRPIHKAIAEPPPGTIGEGADRLGVILVGDRSGPADPFWPPRVFFSLPEDSPEHHLSRAVRTLFRTLEERTIAMRSRRVLAERTHDIEMLNEIGISLAAEMEPVKLAAAILSRARDITQADAGSLYLVEKREGRDVLVFKAAQNDSVRLTFTESVMPLDKTSIAGSVASSGRLLRIADVYELDQDISYRFNRDFDDSHHYRTKSMLVVPIVNRDGRILGVLQLMNRKRRVVPDLATTAIIRRETVAFDEENEDVARSLASQAAVALDNARLAEHLRGLFEGFVDAAVTAIEQRDPTTSGHSERVAGFTCALASATDRESRGPYTKFSITGAELTALRYAAILHDFGKVGVRESVLVKAKKLPAGERQMLAERMEAARLSVAARAWERAARGKISPGQAEREMAGELARLNRCWEAIVAADEPTVLPKESAALIEEAAAIEFSGSDGTSRSLLLPAERAYLTISKGSLDASERREIESHVTQTYRFLSRIPWSENLSSVPNLAYMHHEKLDGSGYPRGLVSKDLPPQARMMTICDMYDALSASDRPYKKAVPPEQALDILREDVRGGRLDRDLLDIFIAAKIYEISPLRRSA